MVERSHSKRRVPGSSPGQVVTIQLILNLYTRVYKFKVTCNICHSPHSIMVSLSSAVGKVAGSSPAVVNLFLSTISN